jgi:RNA polymerase sigma-70 factor (ECF subfamily)
MYVERLGKSVKISSPEPKRRARGPPLQMKSAVRPLPAPEPSAFAERIEPRASDEELVERLARGDQWAKEALYRRYVKVVWSTALHMVGNRADAQDVVQDTFVEALRDLAALRQHAALRPWLLRISVHQAHRRFRRRKLFRRLGLDRSIDDASLEESLHQGATAEQQLELRAVDRALQSASVGERFAWILRYVEGHSLEEVAAACGCSLATAKRRLAGAQQLVKAALGEENHHEL